MPFDNNSIVVRSHVARDLLQSAALFVNAKLVVWEYVSNGLQYVDSGINPIVVVTLDAKNKRISVKDNGSGMEMAGLSNFFVMHGENQDRKQGRIGRGFFGTGKSAAFGIANLLRVTTVRNGKRSVVELSREGIEAFESGENIPIRVLEQEIDTPEQNGTLIEIEEVHLKSLNQREVIGYIERHLSRWNRGVQVFVNNHLCEFSEPSVAERFSFRPEGELGEVVGDVELKLNAATSPLDDDLRGVSIFSNGVWHETTLAGNEKEMTQFIFGEVDVPRLDEDKSPIAPFNLSRSMRLNPENELVRAIYAFINQKIEVVRRKLAEDEKRRKSDELSRRLAQQANEIAQIINEDFADFRQQIAKARAHAAGGHDDLTSSGQLAVPNSDGDILAFGTQVPADVVNESGGVGAAGSNGKNGSEPRNLNPEVEATDEGTDQGQPAIPHERKNKAKGGFHIEFRNMGEETFRARYVSDERTIYINLDHPQLQKALASRSTEDVVFKRLAYEVAFTEYAIALSSELASQGAYLDPFDPISDIRETIHRIANRAAHLYTE